LGIFEINSFALRFSFLFKLYFADELFDGTSRTGRSDSWQRHRPVGCVAECDGFEDRPSSRTIDTASYLAPELHGKACDMLPEQAASVAALLESHSKCHLHFF
jgi:hypothetical protein